MTCKNSVKLGSGCMLCCKCQEEIDEIGLNVNSTKRLMIAILSELLYYHDDHLIELKGVVASHLIVEAADIRKGKKFKIVLTVSNA